MRQSLQSEYKTYKYNVNAFSTSLLALRLMEYNIREENF